MANGRMLVSAAAAVLMLSSGVQAQTRTTTTTVARHAATSKATAAPSATAIEDDSGGCFSGYASNPLASQHFSYPSGVPYQVEGNTGACRGDQVGYNICNSTTEGQDSLCQTSFVNSIDDFCLWAPIKPNSLVADVEGEMVAWCTKPGRGTRLIPEGALKGVQFLRAPAYVAITGYIDQSMINIQADDTGGEEDPHGADGLGNPMGSLMFSQAFASGGSISDNTAWTQVIEWHNFMGGNMFCLKACDPSGSNAANYCQHIYDRIGCFYNVPAAYVNGTFESCESDNQMFPGVYVGDNGKTSTYTQPPESLGDISTMPYQPFIPSSSKCTPYQSASLYSELAGIPAATTATPSAASTSSSSMSSTDSSSSSSSSKSSSSGTSSSSRAGLANAAKSPSSTSSSSTGAASPRAVSTSAYALAGLVVFLALGAAL